MIPHRFFHTLLEDELTRLSPVSPGPPPAEPQREQASQETGAAPGTDKPFFCRRRALGNFVGGFGAIPLN